MPTMNNRRSHLPDLASGRLPAWRLATLGVLPVVLAIGQSALSAAAPPAFPLKVSENRRYLADQRGTPFLYHADTPWLLFYRPTLAEVDLYLADRKAKGFTALQVHLLAGREEIANADGEFPLLDLRDLATPNEKFFARVEAMVERARQEGFLLSIAPAWLGCCSGGWRDIMKANGMAKNRNFGRYVGRRFAKFSNIMWILGGDKDPGEYMQFVRAMAEGIRETAPGHLMTAHPGSPISAVQVYGGERWLDVNSTYTYSPDITSVGRPQFHVYAAAISDYNRIPVRPFILLESAYENERNSTPQVIRRQAYWAYLSGAFGHAMGNRPIYTMDPGWKEALQQPASQSMAHLASLLRLVPWHTLVPDQKHEWVTSGFGAFETASGKDENYRFGFDYVTAAASTDGRWLVAYLPAGNRITVNLGKFAGPVRALWFDPTAGAWSAAADALPNSGAREFAPPGQNAGAEDDWVLVLRR